MIKGPSVTKGYYRDPEKTAELFDSEGFLHTGDIGQMLPGGRLKIIDRKKHIFKLAQVPRKGREWSQKSPGTMAKVQSIRKSSGRSEPLGQVQ